MKFFQSFSCFAAKAGQRNITWIVHSNRAEITVQQGILMKGDRVIIPSKLRLDVLDKIHTGHQGIQKCRERAKSGVWWPNLSKQIEDLVRECPTCIKTKTNRAEPMIPSQLPERPFQKVGTDLFEWKGQEFVLVVDYFSRYCEIGVLRKSTSQEVINHLKAIFARHGIPETVISDNGPQYSSAEFAKFAEDWGFTHITSSPKYPQSNGEAERMVQTTKNLLTKSDDPYEGLFAYRTTPLENGFSQAEICMGRRLRTTLPTTPSKLTQQRPDSAGSPLPDPPEVSKDQSPVLPEKREALRSAQTSTHPRD